MPVRALLAAALLVPLAASAVGAASAPPAFLGPDAVKTAVARLVARHGEALGPRIRQGVEQAARLWRPEDGDAASFAAFCETHFLADPAALAAAFARLEDALEQTDGRLHEIRRELTTPLDLDTGPVSEIDRLLVGLDLQAHVDEDLFRSKVAFFALLNFPVHTLAERLALGSSWDRDAWARSRLMDRFAQRVPAEVAREITRANTEADRYIAEYNIRMDRLIAADGTRPFPEGLRLISHWGLRDELASRYEDPDGLSKQRMIQRVMERIVRQEIPKAVVDNPGLLWCPETNEARPAPGAAAVGAEIAAREPDTRYERWLDVFRAVRRADPYVPTAPSYIIRRFELDRQIPAKQVEALLASVLESAEVKEVADLIRRRLGRPLEPFDVWYPGFKPRGTRDESGLDAIVRARYPTAASFQAALPGILESLGFSRDKAAWIAGRIVVDPSRGAGHAMGAVRRGDAAHLRTRVSERGMDYKGYNIAVHELGHNVEQVLSLDGIDHWALSGVPNNAFTEAIAFVFQDRDLELLGLAPPGDEDRALEALRVLWEAYEIGGVALVDMKAWEWLYAHEDASPAELREAVLAIARDVWNRYYAPVFGVRDREILAIYSHMISSALYLPDYAIGHIVAFQLAEKLRSGGFGAEIERMARRGRVTPDAWMREAVGSPVSADALLREARAALREAGK